MSELLKLGALELAEKIKSKKVSSFEVVETHIEHAKKLNPKINAIIEERFSTALDEAKKIDPNSAALLNGVPFTMKEMIHVEGMKSTLGSHHSREHKAPTNATVTERIKNAGGILLGTTNVPEVGFWFECDNVVYGKTKNPYNPNRTSGGSSGGEGAIIGAGASPFGIGSDIGGSVRIPAAFCGVFGHKPSERLIPFTGHTPLFHSNAKEIVGKKYPFTVLGPIAKKAKDLRFLMTLLMGRDQYDQEAIDFSLKAPVTDYSNMTVWILPNPKMLMVPSASDELSHTVFEAAHALEERGAKIKELPAKIFHKAFLLWTAKAKSIEDKNFLRFLSQGNKINFPKEFLNIAANKRNYTFPSLITAITESLSSRRDISKDLKELELLKNEMNLLLGENNIILMPVHPRTAPRHHTTYVRPFDFCYTGIFNALNLPASSAPMGLSKEGLPLSVQIIAANQQDHLCLSVCETLEQEFGGWVMPKELS